METIKSCRDFITICKDIFDCIERQKPCYSDHLGLETENGFVLENTQTGFDFYPLQSCEHWGIRLITLDEQRVFCSATRNFKVKSFPTFCQSYEWICKEASQCLKARKRCLYTNGGTSNYTVVEHGFIGIPNFQMPQFDVKENPRKLIPDLYTCNKKHGFQHQV